MSPFGKRHEVEDELREQIADLRDEVSALTRKLSRRGAATYEGSRDVASDFYDEMTRRLRDAVPMLRKRAGVIEQSARDNPALTAMVGLAVIGLAISFFAVKRHLPDISSFEE
jgi:hypothetical protein